MSLKQLWGNACWYLFHTLAYKLKEGEEHLIPNILQNIKNVCRNLPCPDCSEHAIKTLSHLRCDLIRRREDLIEVLRQFHNSVNKRIKEPQFSREEHDIKYESAVFDKIVANFLHVMSLNFPSNERAMIYTMQRKRMLNDVASFINQNRDSFN